MVTFGEILMYYRKARLKYPPPDKCLSKQQSTTWRLLQTRTFPCPSLYSRIYPAIHTPQCKTCGAPNAELDHIIWACPEATHSVKHSTNPTFTITTAEQWEALLLSTCPEDQLWAVRLAEDAARIQGLAAA